MRAYIELLGWLWLSKIVSYIGNWDVFMFVSESTVGSDWKRLSVLYDFATQYLRSYFFEDVFWNLVTKCLTSLTSASIIYEAVKEVRLVEIIHFLHFVILTPIFSPYQSRRGWGQRGRNQWKIDLKYWGHFWSFVFSFWTFSIASFCMHHTLEQW